MNTNSATRAFRKSWGGEITGTGASFNIWAPDEGEIKLRLQGMDHPMTRKEDGWFTAELPDVGAGAEYAFVLTTGQVVPDPGARAQVGDVHGPSKLVDPSTYNWKCDWQGRPWEEAVILELHIGTFTTEGTFRAAIDKLPQIAETGVTAIEIMPVAQFAGNRGWGYDGVLPYAVHPAYGSPDDLRALIDAAHEHGLMVLLDVVYNHFGPEGNYLGSYASDFFDAERQTPWGDAIAYSRDPVRRFFIENALYWLHEFRLDGLRLDAVDHVRDPNSDPEILVEIAQRIRETFPDRHIHLTTEDNRNITRLHERSDGKVSLYTGEWNDDFHNVAHVIATGETEGYYADFGEDHWGKFARSLAEGFVWQGEYSAHADSKRGEPSAHLPPTAFVDFLQNHDQTGNRAFGERLLPLSSEPMVRALMAIHLLSPHIPLMFMGEEWGETRPFAFFTDFDGELAEAVREGRRREFAAFAEFQNEALRAAIPDPNAITTFEASRIDWERRNSAEGQDWLKFTSGLLATRQRDVVPHLAGTGGNAGKVLQAEDGVIAVDWALNGATLRARANLTDTARQVPEAKGRVLYTTGPESGELPPFSVVLRLEEGGSA